MACLSFPTYLGAHQGTGGGPSQDPTLPIVSAPYPRGFAPSLSSSRTTASERTRWLSSRPRNRSAAWGVINDPRQDVGSLTALSVTALSPRLQRHLQKDPLLSHPPGRCDTGFLILIVAPHLLTLLWQEVYIHNVNSADSARASCAGLAGAVVHHGARLIPGTSWWGR